MKKYHPLPNKTTKIQQVVNGIYDLVCTLCGLEWRDIPNRDSGRLESGCACSNWKDCYVSPKDCKESLCACKIDTKRFFEDTNYKHLLEKGTN